jgi:hypothetical protein
LVYSQSWLNLPKDDRRFGSVCFFPFCDVAQVVIIPITIFIQIWRYAKHESGKSLAVVVIFYFFFRFQK